MLPVGVGIGPPFNEPPGSIQNPAQWKALKAWFKGTDYLDYARPPEAPTTGLFTNMAATGPSAATVLTTVPGSYTTRHSDSTGVVQSAIMQAAARTIISLKSIIISARVNLISGPAAGYGHSVVFGYGRANGIDTNSMGVRLLWAGTGGGKNNVRFQVAGATINTYVDFPEVQSVIDNTDGATPCTLMMVMDRYAGDTDVVDFYYNGLLAGSRATVGGAPGSITVNGTSANNKLAIGLPIADYDYLFGHVYDAKLWCTATQLPYNMADIAMEYHLNPKRLPERLKVLQ